MTQQHVALDALLEALIERVADRVADRLMSGPPGLVDQSRSPLGRRRHIQAVRKRMASGDAGAVRVGRRYLLAPDVLAAELQSIGSKPAAAVSPASSVHTELERELRVRVVKGGRSNG